MSDWGANEDTPMAEAPVDGTGNASVGGTAASADDGGVGGVGAATISAPAPATPAQFVEFDWNAVAAAAEQASATTFAPSPAAEPTWGSYGGAEAIPPPPAYGPAHQPSPRATYAPSYVTSYQPPPPPIHDRYGRAPINYGGLDEKPTSDTLFVGNLSSRADETLLRASFGHHGVVAEARLPIDRDTGMRKGFGYVAIEDAQTAKNPLSGVEIGGREVRPDYATSRSSARPRPDRGGYGREPEPARNDPSNTLFVGGLPYDISEDTVRETFQAFGSISSIRLPTDRETQKPKGFGYVEFSSEDEAIAAFDAMNGANLGGRSLRVDYAAPRAPRPDREGGDGDGRGSGGANNPKSSTIFVAGVSYDATEDHIREAFQVYGTIVRVRLPTDEDGKTKGFGYVEFDTVDEARAAFEALDGAEVASRSLRLDYVAERDRPSREIEEEDPQEPDHGPSNTLFVGSLSRSANEDMVREAFSPYGTITGCRLPTDKESGEMKGFAYVSFETQELAEAAVAGMNGKTIDGRRIRLDYAEARPEPGSRPAREKEDPRNDPTDTLWIGGVSRNSTEDSYRAAFEPFGTVTRVFLAMDKDADPPHPKGYGYVGFSSVEEAIAACAAKNGEEIDERQIRIDYAEPRPAAGRRPRPGRTNNPPSCTLFVGGIDSNSNEDAIREAFRVHGTVVGIRLQTDDSGNPKFGHVEFDTVDEAVAAFEALNGTFRLDYAADRGGGGPGGGGGDHESRELQEPTNEPTDTLFVGGISRDSTEDSIREAFAPFGEITRCHLVMDKDSEPPQPKGFGYVAFSSMEEAIAAVAAMNGKQVDGRQIRLDYSEPRLPRDEPEREPDPPTIDPTDTLFVGGISRDSTEDSIREAFAPFGKITRYYLVMDKDSDPPQPKGFGYVAFSSIEEAIAACAAMNGKKLDGRQLRIDYSEPRPDRVFELKEVVPPESLPNSILFVAGVSKDSTEDSYRKAFSRYGNVIRVYLQRDPDTDDLKGIGWVGFSSVAEAEAAVEGLNGKEIDGRQIRLDYSEPRSDDPNKMLPKLDDQARHFDPNEIQGGIYHRLSTRVEPAVNLPDRFELFLLQDGEKKITEQIDTRKLLKFTVITYRKMY